MHRDWRKVEKAWETFATELRAYGAIMGEHLEQCRGWAVGVLDIAEGSVPVADRT